MRKDQRKILAYIAPFLLALFPTAAYWRTSNDLKMTLRTYLIFVSLFAALNIITYIAYFYDKQQARSNRWRVKENTLHAFALVGGWPAAYYAIEKIRHKSSKRSFQIVFWLTVLANLAGSVYLFLVKNVLSGL